ncbi:MAG TPA: MBL fold metallo-hydrolase [Solirubrobacteraceae bacterium]|nr:MBL fold metallo-hydrolase [Solirubrobacteraceae bacterium]
MGRLELPGHDAIGIRANNPGPLTLSGTNTWIYGREPCWLIDPGPSLPEHLDAISAEIDERGGLGAVLLTHDHPDHAEAVPEIVARFSPVPLAAGRGAVNVLLEDGERYGPFELVASPGHAPDHFAFVVGDLCFSGDAVLGEGSVFVSGQLDEYLGSLRLMQARRLSVIAPGHGPVVLQPAAKLAQYLDHRLAREAALVSALADGRRTVSDLLDAVWGDTPAQLRPAAAITLEAHLEKLELEGRLPPDVQRR